MIQIRIFVLPLSEKQKKITSGFPKIDKMSRMGDLIISKTYVI